MLGRGSVRGVSDEAVIARDNGDFLPNHVNRPVTQFGSQTRRQKNQPALRVPLRRETDIDKPHWNQMT